MKRLFFLAAATVIISAASCNNFAPVERGFVAPPDDVRIGVYWYWINDNISSEGVVRDLEAMKQAGITRAFIGNIGGQDYPNGDVKIFTDKWWEALHTALKTAAELDIEIGIFNSPGWSQSGGPWVKPQQAMRYVATAERRVSGPVKFSDNFADDLKDFADFQDLKTIAIKLPSKEYRRPLPAKLNHTRGGWDITLAQPSIVRAILVYPKSGHSLGTECELQAKVNGEFVTLKKFGAYRGNAGLNVGFDPIAPVVVSLPATTAAEFRLLTSERRQNGIADIVLSETPVMERYPEKTLAKMYQWPLPYWESYMWEAQPDAADATNAIAPSQVVDITQYLSADGTVNWDVPEGEWLILRTGMLPTGVTNAPASPEGTGLEVDKMSKQHVAAHFDAFLGEIMRRIPAADRKTFKVIVEDSYETGGQNITDGMLEEFQQRYGYDPVPFLPVLRGYVIGSADVSDRFLWDLRRMIADKVSYDYVGGLREVGNKHGLTTWLENYGHWGFPGEFLQYGGQSDEIGGEFWAEGELGSIECRAASSCAHIYGKKRVWAESFTSAGNTYYRHPALLKRRGDWSFTEGINSTLFHVSIQQYDNAQYPGVDAWFGVEFNRKNAWFPHLDLFTQYMRRCNFMLQQGLDVADVAYFIGEDAPKMTGIMQPALPKGYSFDYINAEVIINNLTVKNGRLVLPHGTSYRLLVLPPQETMRPEVLQKIEKLVAAGAIILGNPPQRSPSMQNYPAADKQVKELADKMWGDTKATQRTYGKGTILSNIKMEEAFAFLNLVPDCRVDSAVLYTHRKLADGDIYFLTNQSDRAIAFTPQFRVTDSRYPEAWDAVTGVIRELPAFEQTDTITQLPMKLEAGESVFVVFRNFAEPPSQQEENYPQPTIVAEITSPWKVTFESDDIKRGAPEAVVFEQLQDWTQHADPRIRYYSGAAVYHNSFIINELPQEYLFLEIGSVGVMAKVKINGQYAGGVWTAPYRIDITKFAKAGDNTIEIEVVNTWTNRIIGDLQLPEGERRVSPFHLSKDADSPLQASGLTGTVKITAYPY